MIIIVIIIILFYYLYLNVNFLLEFSFYSMAQQSPVGPGLPIIETFRSHSDTPHPAGLLWTSDKPVEETST
jgi:hypothetical protein